MVQTSALTTNPAPHAGPAPKLIFGVFGANGVFRHIPLVRLAGSHFCTIICNHSYDYHSVCLPVPVVLVVTLDFFIAADQRRTD